MSLAPFQLHRLPSKRPVSGAKCWASHPSCPCKVTGPKGSSLHGEAHSGLCMCETAVELGLWLSCLPLCWELQADLSPFPSPPCPLTAPLDLPCSLSLQQLVLALSGV